MWIWVVLLLAVAIIDGGGGEGEDGGGAVYHNQFAVHVRSGGHRKADEIAARHGFVNLGQIGSLEDHFLLEHPRIHKRSAEGSGEHAVRLGGEPEVVWIEQQMERRRVKRDFRELMMEEEEDEDEEEDRYPIPSDPLFEKQWFLNHGAADGSDMNVVPAWRRGFTGKGVVVTILDDGIQSNHPDLKLNYDPKASTDINDSDEDPMPQDNGDNKHGTRCAGEVAAQAYNGVCGVGVAYNASIGGVRMLDGVVNDAVEAKALSLNPNHIDIYSASWGPEDDGKTVDGPGPLAKKAFINGIKSGRQGRGSIFVWASGNGGRKDDNCNCDGYTNSIFTLSISSATQGGRKPWYLEECSSTLATTYSSGTPSHDASITTVDQDARLRKDKMCTSAHTGTSASAPIAAGICALALESNPRLSWRDMQHIVLLTANPKPLLGEPGWLANGVGRQYSLKFGYGLMDADAMVELAQVWPGAGQQLICETDTLEPNVAIPTDPNDVARVSITTSACGGTDKGINFLEHVQCKVTLSYSPRGALHLVLTSPSGTKSALLLPRPRDKTGEGFTDWPFLSVHYWGEPANGTWTLDAYRSSSVGVTTKSSTAGIIKKWKLLLYGTKENPLKKLAAEEVEDQDEFGVVSNILSNMLIDGEDAIPEDDQYEYLQRPKVYLNDTKLGPDGCSEECRGGCVGGINNCVACRNFKFGTICIPKCPKGTFPTIEGTCEECHSGCLACYGPLERDCLSCRRGTLLESGCVSKCPPGFRLNQEGDRECLPCPKNCASCNDGSACQRCREGFALSADGAGCISDCLSGFYADSKSGSCEKCDEKCSTCIGPRTTQCSICRQGTFFYERNCVNECPEGFHPDRRIGECVPCPQGCSRCNSDDSSRCVQCKANWKKDAKTGGCVPKDNLKCGTVGTYGTSGTASSPGTPVCRQCHQSCSSCHGSSAEDCLSCPDSHLLHISSCVDNGLCPQGTYPFSGRECRHCPHACAECEGAQSCTRCHEGYALSAEKGVCVANCGEAEYKSAGGVCQRCHATCKTCAGQGIHSASSDGEDSCLSCPAGRLLLGGKCLKTAPRGYHESKNGLWFLRCHAACLDCFGGGHDQCNSCRAGKKLVGDSCVGCSSKTAFYNTATSSCESCHESCGACSGPADDHCTACLPPKVLNSLDNVCVSCCEEGAENGKDCCKCNKQKNSCLASMSAFAASRKNRSFRAEDIIGSSSRSAMLFFVVAATVMVTTFLMLTAWKKLKRRRRLRTPSYPNGWKNSRNNSDDGGKIPLMTLNNHFQDDFDDDDDIDDNDDGLDNEVVVNGAVNGGRHSFT